MKHARIINEQAIDVTDADPAGLWNSPPDPDPIAPAPEPPPLLSPVHFMLRFSAAERAAIRGSNDPEVVE